MIDEKDIIEERSDNDLLTHSVSTEPLLSLSKKRVSNISGSTFYFVLQCELNVTYTYKIQKASCERIKKNSNVIAVQTLQFQKKKRYLNGSSLMVSNAVNDYFQLFFVSY